MESERERIPTEPYVITFRPDATENEKQEFLTEFAQAILGVARNLVDKLPPG